jgi:hypothetical protein
MSNTWLPKYDVLKSFVDNNPKIIITKNSCYIPKSLRSEFYRLFNNVRLNFILDVFPSFVNDSETLAIHYKAAEEVIVKHLNINEISYSSKTGKFLDAPIDEMERELFNPLFDLLKDKINHTAFQKSAQLKIESSFRKLYRSGYEKWVLFILMNHLKADQLYQVDIKEISTSDLYKLGAVRVEEASGPHSSTSIKFREDNFDKMFIVPDVIFHSSLLHKYVAYKAYINRPLMMASNLSAKREWLPAFSTLNNKLDIALLYIADDPEDISVVADAKYICRPDMVIDCKVEDDWVKENGMDNVIQNRFLLQPYTEYVIISKDPAVTEDSDSAKDGIVHLDNVGFDTSQINKILHYF